MQSLKHKKEIQIETYKLCPKVLDSVLLFLKLIANQVLHNNNYDA